MSHMGRNYFHTDSPTDLGYLIGVLTEARNAGQGVRLLTDGGRLQVSRGWGAWSAPLNGTPCSQRDEVLDWQKPAPLFSIVGQAMYNPDTDSLEKQ